MPTISLFRKEDTSYVMNGSSFCGSVKEKVLKTLSSMLAKRMYNMVYACVACIYL